MFDKRDLILSEVMTFGAPLGAPGSDDRGGRPHPQRHPQRQQQHHQDHQAQAAEEDAESARSGRIRRR